MDMDDNYRALRQIRPNKTKKGGFEGESQVLQHHYCTFALLAPISTGNTVV